MNGITLKSDLKDITIDGKGNITISFAVKGVNKYRFEEISNQIQTLENEAKNGLKITIDKYRNKRTLTQNDSLWYLCEELSKEMHSTKEEIYREYILKVGKFEIVPIRNDVVEFWVKSWESNGIGWQCKNLRESKLDGYTNIDCYFGTSVYDTKEMARLLEEVIGDCQKYNIDWEPFINRITEE